MAYPIRPARVANFQQDANTGASIDPSDLDSELNNLVEALDQTQDFVRGITTASGALKNLATATAQALAGSQRFVATASQTQFDTSITWGAAFTNLNVEVFAQGVKLDPNLLTVADNAGTLRVTIPAQTLSNVVVVNAFESGAGVLTRLATTGSGSDGANMVGIQDAGARITATTVEGALQEIALNLSTFITSVGTIANYLKKDGSVVPTADLPMGAHKITGLANGVAATDAATVAQVSAASATLATLANSFIKRDGTNSPSADTSWNNKKITSLATPTASGDAANKSYVDTTAAPTGASMLWFTAVAPTGWLLCDGSAISRTTYSALFALLSTTYGVGDGTTTFNLPDFRGRSPLGAGTGAQKNASGTGVITGGTAMTARALGAWGGEETHVQTTAELASHNHSMKSSFESGSTGSGMAGSSYGGAGNNTTVMETTGTSSAMPWMHPFTVVNFIIKT